jgi:hypothetical protein
MYRDQGDRMLREDLKSREAMLAANAPASQMYHEAFRPYHEAFRFSDDYFPGINAATLAAILGRKEAEGLAHSVLDVCRRISVRASGNDRFWIFATEGDANLLLGKSAEACDFYRCAVGSLRPGKANILQSTYNQLCRLYWAFGRKVVEPVLDVLRRSELWSELKPGPLGDCEGARSAAQNDAVGKPRSNSRRAASSERPTKKKKN